MSQPSLGQPRTTPRLNKNSGKLGQQEFESIYMSYAELYPKLLKAGLVSLVPLGELKPSYLA